MGMIYLPRFIPTMARRSLSRVIKKSKLFCVFLWFHELTGACMGFIDIVFFARLYALPLKNFDQYRFYQVLSY